MEKELELRMEAKETLEMAARECHAHILTCAYMVRAVDLDKSFGRLIDQQQLTNLLVWCMVDGDHQNYLSGTFFLSIWKNTKKKKREREEKMEWREGEEPKVLHLSKECLYFERVEKKNFRKRRATGYFFSNIVRE